MHLFYATLDCIQSWSLLRLPLRAYNCKMEKNKLHTAHDVPDENLPDSCDTATQHVRFQTSGFTIQTSHSWRAQAPTEMLPAQQNHRRTRPEAMQPWPCQVTAASFVLGDQQSSSNSRAQPAPSQPGAAEGTEGVSRGKSARPDFSVAYALAASDREPGIVPLVTLGSVFTLIKERHVPARISAVALYDGHDILQRHSMGTSTVGTPVLQGPRRRA